MVVGDLARVDRFVLIAPPIAEGPRDNPEPGLGYHHFDA